MTYDCVSARVSVWYQYEKQSDVQKYKIPLTRFIKEQKLSLSLHTLHVSIDISDCAALDDRTQSRGENVISAKIAESQGMMPAIFLFNEGRYRRIYPAYNNKLRREKYWEHVGLASPRDQTDGKFSSRCCRAMKANCVALFVVFNSMSVEDCLTRRHIRVIYPNCQRWSNKAAHSSQIQGGRETATNNKICRK